MFALPSKDAIPTEMPDLAFTYPSTPSPTISSKITDTVNNDEKPEKPRISSHNDLTKKSSNNANKSAKESDNMSAVSIGTSSLSSTSSSESSPASSSSSDTVIWQFLYEMKNNLED